MSLAILDSMARLRDWLHAYSVRWGRLLSIKHRLAALALPVTRALMASKPRALQALTATEIVSVECARRATNVQEDLITLNVQQAAFKAWKEPKSVSLALLEDINRVWHKQTVCLARKVIFVP